MSSERVDTTAPPAGADLDLRRYLEPHQLVAGTSRPLPRAQLGRGARCGLWAMRVIAIVLSMMVIYTFISQVL